MTGLVWAAALLLGAAGVAKLLHPGPTVRAAADSGMPGSSWLTRRWLVRLVGLIEFTVAAAVVLAGGSRPAALLAAIYALLAAVAWGLMRDGRAADCGCFGRSTQPVGRAHLMVDGAGVVIGVGAVWWPPSALLDGWAQDPMAPVVLGGAAIVLSWLAYLSMTALPAVARLRTKVAAAS